MARAAGRAGEKAGASEAGKAQVSRGRPRGPIRKKAMWAAGARWTTWAREVKRAGSAPTDRAGDGQVTRPSGRGAQLAEGA